MSNFRLYFEWILTGILVSLNFWLDFGWILEDFPSVFIWYLDWILTGLLKYDLILSDFQVDFG